jgi:phosphonoacetate hydrolase
MKAQSVLVNGRIYRWPDKPLTVICCDGSEPEYIERARAAGLMPNLEAMLERGDSRRALSAMPSFTNPNNLSIVTGAPPAVHGINGNYLLDRSSGEEVMMNDPKWLRAPTLFAEFQKAGARVAVVTAKDKLRGLLGNGLTFDGSAVCFSSERADQANLDENGIENACELVGMSLPEVYSAELSEFVMAAGAKLLTASRPDIMYLSTTDYIQHKHAPGSAEANRFYAMMDRYIGALHRGGASIVLTADHGMKDKHLSGGEPDVVFLEEALDARFGRGQAKVILPITDPYVVHHGALGSFAMIYLFGADGDAVAEYVRGIAGIDLVLNNREACARFELPADRTGDLVVVSGGPRASKVIGSRRSQHDLSGLKEPLRSHGGLSEQEVPFFTSRKIVDRAGPLRNFDAFFIGCNHLAALPQAAE